MPQVVHSAEIQVDVGFLGYVSDPFMYLASFQVGIEAQYLERSTVFREHAGDEVDGGRFPCAVWTEETKDLTRFDLKGKVVNGNDLTKPACDGMNRDRFVHLIASES